MKAFLWIGLGIVVAVTLVLAALVGGWVLWGRHMWVAGLPAAGTGYDTAARCGGWGAGLGRGMMGGGTAGVGCISPVYGTGGRAAESAETLSIEDARQAVEQYVAELGYVDLRVSEMMEFERNFYAIVEEPDTGIGAMELLVDRWTGAVGPEMGPNMMWNARYGMHGRGGMMGWAVAEASTISADEALAIAQRWLDAYRPGVTVEEHADPFYGYYTIHTQEDGQIEGMLSVHGSTGQVWYHTWHGEFIQMLDEEEGR